MASVSVCLPQYTYQWDCKVQENLRASQMAVQTFLHRTFRLHGFETLVFGLKMISRFSAWNTIDELGKGLCILAPAFGEMCIYINISRTRPYFRLVCEGHYPWFHLILAPFVGSIPCRVIHIWRSARLKLRRKNIACPAINPCMLCATSFFPTFIIWN